MSQLTTDPGAFLQWLKESIPLAAAMQIEALQFDGQQLEMRVPLAANVNDKGTGFGGSIAALATLAGWSLTTLYLRRQGAGLRGGDRGKPAALSDARTGRFCGPGGPAGGWRTGTFSGAHGGPRSGAGRCRCSLWCSVTMSRPSPCRDTTWPGGADFPLLLLTL